MTPEQFAAARLAFGLGFALLALIALVVALGEAALHWAERRTIRLRGPFRRCRYCHERIWKVPGTLWNWADLADDTTCGAAPRGGLRPPSHLADGTCDYCGATAPCVTSRGVDPCGDADGPDICHTCAQDADCDACAERAERATLH